MKTGKTMGDIVHIMQYIMHICPSFQFEVGGHKLEKTLKILDKNFRFEVLGCCYFLRE